MYRPLTKVRTTDIPVTIVVLTKFPHIFRTFFKSVEIYATNVKKVVVKDGDNLDTEEFCFKALTNDYKVLLGPKNFSMAGNANQGWRAVQEDHDILYVGDDVQFLSNNIVEELRNTAYSDPSIGLLSPRILGGCDNPIQNQESIEKLIYTRRSLALICTYIKRSVINKVGYLDDTTFPGTYGWEDYDFCRRVINAGFKLAIIPQLVVHHGIERGTDDMRKMGKGTETFFRNNDWNEEDLMKQVRANERRYYLKWGDTKKEF